MRTLSILALFLTNSLLCLAQPEIITPMVEELCTRYGDLFMIWFDGGADDPRGGGPYVEPIVNKYQPGCQFYHNIGRADFRWGGSETGTVGYPCWSTFPVPCSHHKRIES